MTGDTPFLPLATVKSDGGVTDRTFLDGDLRFCPFAHTRRRPHRAASAGIAEVSELARGSGQGADQILAAAAELNKQAAALRHDATELVNRVSAVSF